MSKKMSLTMKVRMAMERARGKSEGLNACGNERIRSGIIELSCIDEKYKYYDIVYDPEYKNWTLYRGLGRWREGCDKYTIVCISDIFTDAEVARIISEAFNWDYYNEKQKKDCG